MSETHNFQRSLQESHNIESRLDPCFAACFPNTTHRKENDKQAQARSIDWWFTHNDFGDTFSVEVKTRKPPYYGDMLLEIWSSVEHSSPGWICKEQSCDWFLYILLELKEAYKFTGADLSAAWAANSTEWTACMQVVRAKNQGYTTESRAIPLGIFRKAVPSFEVITWK